MTEREALIQLATPEPEPFHQVRPTVEDNERWQVWRDRTNEALGIARSGWFLRSHQSGVT